MTEVRTSLHGKRVGLDEFNNLYAEKGFREAATTASTATTIEAGGVTLLAATTAAAFTIAAPYLGAMKTLVATSTSTGQAVSTPSTASIFQSTAASTSGGGYIKATFTGVGQVMELLGISSSIWQVRAAHASVSLTTV